MAAPAPKPRIRYAAIYVRVSTADQGERYSPASQKEKLLAKAGNEGYEVLPEHIFLDKHTGKELRRPAFERLRALVKTGAVQVVLALCLDRFSRKVHDAALVAAEFKRHGCALDFVEMKNDDSPEGRLQFNIMASMAEFMGEKILQRGMEGRQKMLDAELIPGGPPPYGYETGKKLNQKGKRIPIPFEVKIVNEMMEQSRNRRSDYAIAADLNARGILSKGMNGKPPGPWSRTTVAQVLTNRHYIGEYRSRSSDRIIPVPRIVSDELFFAVQAQREPNGRQWVGRPSENYLGRNFLHCKYCGHRMNGTGKRRCRSYVCSHRTNKPPIKRICNAPQVKSAAVDIAMWIAIWSMLKDPAMLLAQARAYVESMRQPENETEGNAAMKKELSTLQKAVANKTKMLKQGHLDWDEEKGGMLEMKRRIAFLEAELNAIRPVIQLPPEHVVESYLREITEGAEPETYNQRRRILEGLLELHMTYGEGELEITGKVPVGPIAAAESGNPLTRYPHSSVDCYVNSVRAIPFILKRRVA